MFTRLLLGKLHLQRDLILSELDLAGTEQFHVLNLAYTLLGADCQRWNDRFIFRPTHHEGVERAALGGEANVLGG